MKAGKLNRRYYVLGIVISLFLLFFSIYYFNSASRANKYDIDFRTAQSEEMEDGGFRITFGGISLPKGNYSLRLAYISDSENILDATIDNQNVFHRVLPPTSETGGIEEISFSLGAGTDRGRINIYSDGNSSIQLICISFISDQLIYKDGIIWGICCLLLIPFVWMSLCFYKLSSHKKALLAVVLLVIFQCIPFIINQSVICGIDTKAHMMRIEGIYYGLLDGQFPVVIQPEFNNSYGQLAVLYPNVFLYVPAIFRVLGMSQLGMCKLFVVMIIVASGIISYASSRAVFKRDWQMIVCCFIIMMGNMRLQNLYYGGKIGGSFLAELFWPLVVAGIIKIYYGDYRKWYFLAYGMAGVICCHITSATVACLLIAIITAIEYKKFFNKEIRNAFFKAVGLALALCFGTIVCFIRFYFTDWEQSVLQWSPFNEFLWNIRDPFHDMRWTSAIVVMLVCIVMLAICYVRNGKEKIKGSFLLPLMFSAIFLMWMSTAYFPWTTLQQIPAIKYYTNMLQDGARFISISECCFAFCLPRLLNVSVGYVEGRSWKKSKTVVAAYSLIALLAICNFGHEIYSYYTDDELSILYYDEVMGEVEFRYNDYLPGGTKEEWYVSDSGYISNEEAVKSLGYERNGTKIDYTYTNSEEGSYVEFPQFYYEGYVAVDENNNAVPLYKGEKNRIRVYLEQSDSEKQVKIWYKVKWYMTLSYSLSFGVWIVSFIDLLFRVKRRII